MQSISINRGDSKALKVRIKNKDETEFNLKLDEIYITFKRNFSTKEVLFQKTLSNGDITKKDDNCYHFFILPEDTERLPYDKYVFDIEIINKDNKLKKTFLGYLDVNFEATFVDNENISIEGEEGINLDLISEQELDLELDNDVIETGNGSKDYEKLENQPQINGVTLIKNRNSKELKLQEEMDTISNLDIDKIFN